MLLQPAPGYIDGLTSGSNGTFWIAQLMPGQPAFEAMMHSRYFSLCRTHSISCGQSMKKRQLIRLLITAPLILL